MYKNKRAFSEIILCLNPKELWGDKNKNKQNKHSTHLKASVFELLK